MSQIAISKVKQVEKEKLPVFGEISKRIDEIQRRAFGLFERRGFGFGRALDDWLEAEREVMGWPAAELKEEADAYSLHVTLPGFEAKDIEVTATPTEIIVHASVAERKKGKKGEVVWSEFGSNDVYRRFDMPRAINVDKVTAALDKGMLRIEAPQAAPPRAIKVAA